MNTVNHVYPWGREQLLTFPGSGLQSPLHLGRWRLQWAAHYTSIRGVLLRALSPAFLAGKNSKAQLLPSTTQVTGSRERPRTGCALFRTLFYLYLRRNTRKRTSGAWVLLWAQMLWACDLECDCKQACDSGRRQPGGPLRHMPDCGRLKKLKVWGISDVWVGKTSKTYLHVITFGSSW